MFYNGDYFLPIFEALAKSPCTIDSTAVKEDIHKKIFV